MEALAMLAFIHFTTANGPRLINVTEVVEVIPMVWLERDSDAIDNAYYIGLLNYRGNIISVFDPAGGAQQFVPQPDHFLIVCSNSVQTIALIATEVHQLVDIDKDEIRQIDALNQASFSAAKLKDKIIRIVTTSDYIKRRDSNG